VWLERGLGGTTISMQGLGAKYVLILVDGQRQLGRVDGAIDLERFGAAEIEQIEIVRGPGSAMYGSDALGGVVNIITRAPGDERAELDLRVDHRGASESHAAIGGGGGDWSGVATATWRRGDAFDHTPGDPGTTIAAYDDAHAELRTRYRRGDTWRVDGATGYQRRDLQGVDAQGGGAVVERRNLIEVASASLTARRTGARGGATLHAGVGLHRDQFASDQRGATALDQYQDTREHLGELSGQVERRIGERHLATAGAEGLIEGLRSERLRDDGARQRGALWLQDEWRGGESYRWLVVPAVRVDADSQFGVHATPRLAARWDATDQLVTRASVGLGYRAPSFKEQLLRFENPGAGYVVEGNPDLAPETSRSLQAGAEWRPAGRVWLAAGAIANDLTDQITAVTREPGGPGMPIRFGYDNIGRARTAGVELSAAAARGRLRAELGYAYTSTRDLEADVPLDGMPAHRVAGALRWRDPDQGLTAVAELALTGARPYQLGDGMTEAGARVDLRARVARRFGERLELYLGGDNLLGAGDATFDPIPPRTLYAGLGAAL
jgi:outer membrane receptor for ferrienterochelin and colicins